MWWKIKEEEASIMKIWWYVRINRDRFKKEIKIFEKKQERLPIKGKILKLIEKKRK